MAEQDAKTDEGTAPNVLSAAATPASGGKQGRKANLAGSTASLPMASVQDMASGQDLPGAPSKPSTAKFKPGANAASGAIKGSPSRGAEMTRTVPVKAKAKASEPVAVAEDVPAPVEVAPPQTTEPATTEPVDAAQVVPDEIPSDRPEESPAAAPVVASATPAPPQPTPASSLSAQEEKTMDMPTNISTGLNDVMTEAQEKAKDAYEKSTAMMGEAGTFARGNVEAMVESTKLLAAGLQDIGSSMVAESRGVFETMTADLKDLAAAKSPADFMRAQSEMMRKNFDGAVAYSSKTSEAMLKLVTEAMAPLSGRVNVAVEKVKMPGA